MMHGQSSRDVLRHLRTLYAFGVIGDLSDEQLLQCFVRRDEAAEEAFAILVERHGAMVLGVCLRVLGNDSHEAEDAFQATFLVLARKAGSVSRRDKLASWLYGAAVRTANESCRRSARRRARERCVSVPLTVEAPNSELSSELRTILDEELARLPTAHRVAVILCELEGLSRTEAARRLSIPEGTLSSRLARAKSELRDRLTRRGFAISTLAISTVFVRKAQAVSLPLMLIESTVAAATRTAGGTSVAGIITLSVATLTEGVLQAMFVTKLKAMVWGVGTIAAVVSGAMALGQVESTPATARSTVAPPPVASAGPPAPLPSPVTPPPMPAARSPFEPEDSPTAKPMPHGSLVPERPQALGMPRDDVVPPRVPAASNQDRTAALEKKLDHILNALNRLTQSPKPIVPASRDAPTTPSPSYGRASQPSIPTPISNSEAPAAASSSVPLAPENVELGERPSKVADRDPFEDSGDPPNKVAYRNPPEGAVSSIIVPNGTSRNSNFPPITSRLSALETKFDEVSRRMTRLERRLRTLERQVGGNSLERSENLEPVVSEPIQELDPLPTPARAREVAPSTRSEQDLRS